MCLGRPELNASAITLPCGKTEARERNSIESEDEMAASWHR